MSIDLKVAKLQGQLNGFAALVCGVRGCFRSLITAAAASSALHGLGDSTAAESPNIVFILADDLGYMDVASFAARVSSKAREDLYYETPNIDSLVDTGVAFSQAYAHQLCSPTRASLLTGINGASIGFTTATPDTLTYYSADEPTPDGYLALDAIRHADAITTPQALINATTLTALPSGHLRDGGRDEITLAEALTGYDSAFIGKWHLGGHGAAGYQPTDQGFETIAYFDAGGSPYFDWRSVWNRKEPLRHRMPQAELLRGSAGEQTGCDYLTDDLTEQAVRFIRERDTSSGRPFFLYFCHFAVHTPIESRRDYTTHFLNKQTRDGRKRNAAYAGMVRSLDDSVGAILEALEDRRLADDTIVVFMSDNGGVDWQHMPSIPPTSNAPFKGGKATVYEGGIRVPLIVRQPQGPRGVWIDAPIFPVDLFPTLAELAEKPIRHPIDGKSFVSLLTTPAEGAESHETQPFVWHYPFNVIVRHPDSGLPLTPHSAIRDGEYKLIFDWHGGLELYNIEEDPFERSDLTTERPALAKALFQKLCEWIDQRIAARYLPTRNPQYSAARDPRGPFRDLRHSILGYPRIAVAPARE